MQELTKEQLEDYKQLCSDPINGRILIPDGLRFICAANNYNPEVIGKHCLDRLAYLNSLKNR